MTVFCPLSTQPVFYQGRPQVGAQISFYDAGTLTPRVAYSDGLLQNPWQQPLLSDASGCIPPAWLSGIAYRMRIVSPTGVMIRDIDNLPGDPVAPPAPPPPSGAGKPAVTGDILWNYGSAIIAGRVRCNGRTIGSELSGATELADPTTHDLYVWLWNGDSTLAVIGGRGTSADADFNADKPISLPDFSGRTAVMVDLSASGRLNGVTFSSGTATQVGAHFGEATHVTVTTEMPSHTHTATTATGGAHQHTGTTAASLLVTAAEVTDVQGYHSHGGATAAAGAAAIGTDVQGNHAHGGVTGNENQSHTHGYAGFPGFSIGAPGSSTQFWYGPFASVQTAAESNPHNHNISADGSHWHNVSLPNHTHGIVVDGAHQHNFTDTTQPHTHSFVTDSGGAHQHTLTSDPTGGNAAHNNMQPGILITFYLVL